MVYRYALLIAYDGTSFGGWQAQLNAPSIQTTLEQALSVVLRRRMSLIGSGRTDAGVHANGQVAHFDAPLSMDLSRLRLSLNALIPPEIRVLEIRQVPKEFHARYSAISKEYRYHLHLDPIPHPLKRLYSTHLRFPIDLNLLKEGAKRFIGTHDFTSFSNKAHEGSAAKNPIRTLFRIDIVPEEGGVRLEFEANGFLYKMVRNITGTLIDIARGKIPSSSVEAILIQKNRSCASPTAPPQGLFLEKVTYPQTYTIRKK